MPDDRKDLDDDIGAADELAARRLARQQAAAKVASDIAEENTDPTTRREAIEQGLARCRHAPRENRAATSASTTTEAQLQASPG